MPLCLQNRGFQVCEQPRPGGRARWSHVLKRPARGGVGGAGGRLVGAGWGGRWAVFLSVSFSPSLPLKISKLKKKICKQSDIGEPSEMRDKGEVPDGPPPGTSDLFAVSFPSPCFPPVRRRPLSHRDQAWGLFRSAARPVLAGRHTPAE